MAAASGLPAITPEQLRVVKDMNIEAIPAPLPNNFIYVMNPFICGFKLFELALDVNTAGIALENHHHSIFLICHLYNAVLQLGLLQTNWPEADRLIERHIDEMFAGTLPTTEIDQSARLQWQLGYNTTQMPRTPHQLSRLKLRPGMENGPQLSSSKATQIFRPYFDKKTSMEQCLSDLETSIRTESVSKAKTGGNSKPL